MPVDRFLALRLRMQAISAAQQKLARVARLIAKEKLPALQANKDAHKEIDRPDFLWHYLLQSFATMGRSAGLEDVIRNPAVYEQLRYEVLAELAAEKRLPHAERVCRSARRLRMPAQKARYIVGCFERIDALGGLEAAKAELLRQSGAAGKMAFLKRFPGIGDKYSRNILMDVYHEDFRDSIAIDVRIKKVSDCLGLPAMPYAEHEAFYVGAARAAGLNGWELDRLMYNYLADFLSRLSEPTEQN